jgi:hypothetical protein
MGRFTASRIMKGLATMGLRLFWSTKWRDSYFIPSMATSDGKIYKVWKWGKFFELGKLSVR